jgi:hypothetical protein
MNAPCPVIARIVPARDRERSPDAEAGHVPQRDVILFLPHDPANPGNLLSWSTLDSHGEASLGYYRDTKPPRTLGEREAAAAVVRRYRAWMASIPAEDQQEIVERPRLPYGWREHAWA